MGAKESLEGGKEGERQTVYVFSLSFLVLQLYFLTFFNFFHLLFFFENLRFKIYFLEERAGKVKKKSKKDFFYLAERGDRTVALLPQVLGEPDRKDCVAYHCEHQPCLGFRV